MSNLSSYTFIWTYTTINFQQIYPHVRLLSPILLFGTLEYVTTTGSFVGIWGAAFMYYIRTYLGPEVVILTKFRNFRYGIETKIWTASERFLEKF